MLDAGYGKRARAGSGPLFGGYVTETIVQKCHVKLSRN